MCTTCGCGTADVRFGGEPGQKMSYRLKPTAGSPLMVEKSVFSPAPGENTHSRRADSKRTDSGSTTSTSVSTQPGLHHLHYGLDQAQTHIPGMSQGRIVKIERDILAKNNHYAAANRALLAERQILALNLLSSPGSGKTTLLIETIVALGERHAFSVIEGDQQTTNDADRIKATGAPALQINTGKGCHLDAAMVGEALRRLNPPERGIVMIENVGNLVCPAGFDLGENHKVVVLSITEGEDKPLKYPNSFRAASVMILTKMDLLPHLDFDVAQCIEFARRVNPQIKIVQLSAKTGQGMAEWLNWLDATHQAIGDQT